jgi:hypothetical protein
MDADRVVERICSLPVTFRDGSQSALEILAKSGVLQTPEALTIAAVAAHLNEHPELIDAWMLWSEDKRVSSGWYFLYERPNFVVGFYPHGDRLVFKDAITACTQFVFREVKSMAPNISLNPDASPAALARRPLGAG